MKERKMVLRKIWILWYQGLSEVPFIVRKCIDSWIKKNPTWDIVLLDKDNLGEYIISELPDHKLVNLTLTKQSDLIRLQLLAKYGGVWADATTLCMKPLDDWIDNYFTSGFFAFEKPGPDRMLSSWFLVSNKENPIILKWKKRYVSFFIENNFNIEGKIKRKLINIFCRIFNRNEKTTKYWFSPIITKLFRIYPYFIFHYLFERVFSDNLDCQNIWNNTDKISADLPHKIQIEGLFSPLNERIKNEINKKLTPIYKLTCYYDQQKYTSSTLLYYLLEGRHQRKNEL